MKLISLNTWGATQGQAFFAIIKQQAKDTDIFCFQEIFSAPPAAPEVSAGARMRLFEELVGILPEFYGIFLTRSAGYDFAGPVNFEVEHGLATFIRNSIQIITQNSVQIGTLQPAFDPVEGAVKAQVFNLAAADKNFFVINYHGPALPGNKLDTPDRLGNSNQLKAICQNFSTATHILCGDFNLMPDTQSIKILEDAGLKNLIKEFKITNTRNEISWQKYHNRQSFADYTFVSKDIRVKNFEVPYNLVSDHLPMILEFEI